MNLKLSPGKNIASVLYAYIKHDLDIIEETGELKKEHYHLWLEFPSQVRDRDLIHILELSGSNSSAISKQRTDRNFLAYLTHNTINSTLKKQYELESIVTNIDKELFYEWYYDALNKTNKPSKLEEKQKELASYAQRLIDIIEDNPKIINHLDLLKVLELNGDNDLIYLVMHRPYWVSMTFKDAFATNREIRYRHELDQEEKDLIEDLHETIGDKLEVLNK